MPSSCTVMGSLSCLLLLVAACPDSSSTADTGVIDAAADLSADGGAPDTLSPDMGVVKPGWAISLGGTQLDDPTWGNGVQVDSQGNIYLFGRFKNDVTLGSTTLTTPGDTDGWVTKLDTSGQVQWAVQIGGAADQNDQVVRGLCVDDNDVPHIVGSYSERITLGSKDYTSQAGVDYFVASLAPEDGKVTWSMAAETAEASNGGSLLDDCAFDSAGKLVALGSYAGSYTFGSTTLTSPDDEVLVLRLSADKSAVELAVDFGGAGQQSAQRIRLAASGELVVAGSFKTSITQGGQTIAAVDDESDVFVAQLSSTGALNWLVTGGGQGGDAIIDLAVDQSGNAYVGGYIGGGVTDTAPPFKMGAFELPIGAQREMLLAKLDKTGQVLWAKQSRYSSPVGGSARETIRGIALDQKDRLIVTGQAYGPQDFFGQTLNPPNLGGFHVVLGRISGAGEAEWAVSYGHPTSGTYAHGNAVAVDPHGDIIVVGIYTKEVNVGGETFTSKGSYDFFVHKVTPLL